MLDDVDAVCSLMQKGEIVAIKGLGGYQLACDATNADVVARLRQLKRRDAKPFALMARDLDIIRRYCAVEPRRSALLASAAAPIVLLRADGARAPAGRDRAGPCDARLHAADDAAASARCCGAWTRPVVMTSGNLSDEPQVIDDDAARERLGGIATYALIHDREIANRVDDSRRARHGRAARGSCAARAGYAPAPIALPPGFEAAPELLAMGGELKATFCLVKDGEAILSQHQGDLEDAETFDDYRKNLALYAELFDHAPVALVADRHPEYLSSKLRARRARSRRACR